MQTPEWLDEWASKQTYTNNDEMSRLVFKEIIREYPETKISFGPTDDGRYQVSLVGDTEHTVYITKQ